MAHLWKSFVEALAPPRQAERPRRGGVTLNHTVDEHQLPRHEPSNQPADRSSRAALESREVTRANLNRPPQRIPSARVVEVDSSSDEEFQDSRTEHQSRSLAESITAVRVPQAATQPMNQPSSSTQPRCQQQQTEAVEPVQTPSSVESVESINTHTANLLEDVKYFHNTALSYQDAYEVLQMQQVELQTKFSEQAQLVQEASEALKAVEAESTAHHWELATELTTLHGQREADIQQAVGEAMVQYHDQLSSAQAMQQQRDREHQQSIQKLQEQVCALEVSLASQVTLPSVAASSSQTGL